MKIGFPGSRQTTSAELALYLYQITCTVISISTVSSTMYFLRRGHSLNPSNCKGRWYHSTVCAALPTQKFLVANYNYLSIITGRYFVTQ